MTDQPLPTTPLEQHYRALRQMSQAERLLDADKQLADPAKFAERFALSVRRFAEYLNPDAFHPSRSEKPVHDQVTSTLDIVAPLAAQGGLEPTEGASRPVPASPVPFPGGVQSVAASALASRFTDRELLVTRTKDVEGWENTRRGLRLDVLLADAADGTPVVGELKLPGDMDPYFALVQSLACLAFLATPNQRERLSKHYAAKGLATVGEQPRMDAAILLVRDGSAAEPKGRYMPGLTHAAERLAPLLLGEPALSRHVRRISCLAVRRAAEGEVLAERLWAYEAPLPPATGAHDLL